WLSTVDENTSVGMLVAVHVIFSIGLAFLFTPLITTALGSVPKHLYGHGSAIMNTLQQLAGAAGTAVMIAVYSGVSQSAMSRGVHEEVALADGASSAFFACACVAVVALVFSLFITRVPTDGPTHEAE